MIISKRLGFTVRFSNVPSSLILILCHGAGKGELERAFSLFRELQQAERTAHAHATAAQMGASQQLRSGTDGGYDAPYVTPQLWSKLIRACAQRRDYYPDAFNLLREMEAAGVIPTARIISAYPPEIRQSL